MGPFRLVLGKKSFGYGLYMPYRESWGTEQLVLLKKCFCETPYWTAFAILEMFLMTSLMPAHLQCPKITFGEKITICQLDGWRRYQQKSLMHRETIQHPTEKLVKKKNHLQKAPQIVFLKSVRVFSFSWEMCTLFPDIFMMVVQMRDKFQDAKIEQIHQYTLSYRWVGH